MIAVLLLAGIGTLGAETREPTRDEAKEYGLPKGVRVQGQIVTSVAKDSPAAKAGIEPGDVIVKLGDNRIYSRDSVDDFLRVTKPGTEVSVLLKRSKTFKEETVKVTLGEREPKETGIAWEFASLEQLEAALAKAKKEKKSVLVGISGAET